jgi:hypothetical protein
MNQKRFSERKKGRNIRILLEEEACTTTLGKKDHHPSSFTQEGNISQDGFEW